MKKYSTLFKTLLMAVGLLGGVNSVWAQSDVVPTPVYFNDFSFAVSGKDGIEIVGNGVFENDADPRFGRIFHNDPTLTKAKRTNYLKLPSDVLSYSGSTKEMTIGFWVNMKNAADFYWSPLFTAYDRVERASLTVEGNTDPWPKFNCLARKVADINCWGYCDLGDTYNDKGTNAVTSAWLDDKAWHYYTITLTSTTVKVYIDGVIENSWTVDGTTQGQIISGVFDAGAAYATNDYGLKYICLGGNQSDNYNDPDPAFGFDDFAVYNVALTQAQINQIRTNKLNRSVTGTQIGNVDNSTDYLAVTSDKVTLYPGTSYHYKFINYGKGENAWNNWILPVYNTNSDCVIAVRADNWEDKHYSSTINAWGSNAGCTSDFNWDNFPGNMNGATVDMTVSFTKDKLFTMSSTITAVDGSSWTYSYDNDYKYSVNEGTAESPNWKEYDSPISLTSNDYIKVALSVSRSWIDLQSEGYLPVSATIGPKGYTTFSSSYALDFTNVEGATAYYASAVGDGSVTLSQVTGTVEAGTGLVLKGTAGAVVSIPVAVSGDAINAINGNKLVGCPTATTVNNSDNLYVLVNTDDGVEFQPLNGTDYTSVTIPAGKAYLNAGGNTANLRVVFAGETTGIANIEAAKAENDAIYNMAGQRVNGSYKGIVIKNGKKVFVK